MKCKFITAALLMAVASTAAADRPRLQERVFDRLDADGDERVSLDEFQSSRAGDRLVGRGDTDGDGIVTVDELAALHAERSAQAQERLDERSENFDAFIAMLDQDSNGTVTEEEVRSAAFTRMDKNGDGYVTVDEFRPPYERGGRRGGEGQQERPGGGNSRGY